MNKNNDTIKSELGRLRKLFIMPDSPDKFIEFGNELLAMIHDFFQEKGGIHSSITLPELSKIFEESDLPDKPILIKDVLSEIKNKIIKHSVKVGSPYYIGHMTSAIPYFMILLEMIIATLNQNQVKIETAKASSFVEKEFVAWFHRLIFRRTDNFYKNNIQNHKVALGSVTSDGTMANMTALLVAREKAFPADDVFPGVRNAGIEAALRYYGYTRAVILVSTRGHYSLRKSASLLGIGEKNVISIPVDNNNRIDIDKLRHKIKKISRYRHNARTKIMAIIGIAGTTETGNIDPLDELAEISKEVGTHFHVDACWGGSVLLVDEYRYLFSGIEKADSVSVDSHKLLYCPMSMGLALFRNEKDLCLTRHSSQYVIRKNSVDLGRFTIEGSRPFSCLKPWAALKILGKEGYSILFKQAKKSASNLKAMLDACGNFETFNVPELFILIYRFIPKTVRDDLIVLKELTLSGHDQEIKEITRTVKNINRLINALNIKLHKSLRMDDSSFVSRTKLESTPYRPQQIVVLRAVLINPLTTRDILREIVSTHNDIGLQLWEEFSPLYERIRSHINQYGWI
ncbi:MAG: aminotransferase class V-fold PLP-dependent enzyme [Deltaproteobacteria bacterium]|nr:aminotransferase class V-fold PLP-dependent enzyme [Deltaproteobacteria bacterium]